MTDQSEIIDEEMQRETPVAPPTGAATENMNVDENMPYVQHPLAPPTGAAEDASEDEENRHLLQIQAPAVPQAHTSATVRRWCQDIQSSASPFIPEDDQSSQSVQFMPHSRVIASQSSKMIIRPAASTSGTANENYYFASVPAAATQVEIDLSESVEMVTLKLPNERRISAGKIAYTTDTGESTKGRYSVKLEDGHFLPQRITVISKQLSLEGVPVDDILAACRKEARLQVLLRDYETEDRRNKLMNNQQAK